MLHSIGFGHDTNRNPVTPNGKSQILPQHLRSRSPIAGLVKFVRHPVENVGDTLDSWWDGYSKEERVWRQTSEQKKQIQYIRLKEVSNTITIQVNRMQVLIYFLGYHI